MRNIRLVISSIILSSASALSWAQTADEHNAHHPDTAAKEASSVSIQSSPTDTAELEKKMGKQLKAMHDFHARLQKASPDERQALMPEHQDLMQEGMNMMGMASAGMQGMGMMNKMHSQTSKEATAPSGAHHTMMLKRMDMMQSMMQMMMDRMPAPSATTQ